MMLYYLPLEPYVERYTYFMSCVGGWAETHFKNHRVPFVRIEGCKTEGSINAGVVLDAHGRSLYSMSQVSKVVELLRQGVIKDGDVIYTEDFWTPGIESLFYIRQLTGVKFKVGCFFHAQSVDDSDFTRPMKKWLQPIEKGLVEGYDYVFVTSGLLRNLCKEAGFNVDKIHNIGLPYNSHRLLQQLNELGFVWQPKEKYVLFSSRFDAEKNPHFFLDLVEACPDIKFKLVKPRKRLSNDPVVEERAYRLAKYNGNLDIVDTSDKLSYYKLLAGATVQFNCAIQDWVSWTLLEAITFGCKVLYPDWKDFPYELKEWKDKAIYKNRDLADASKKLRRLLAEKETSDMSAVVKKHDNSWMRYLLKMGVI